MKASDYFLRCRQLGYTQLLKHNGNQYDQDFISVCYILWLYLAYYRLTCLLWWDCMGITINPPEQRLQNSERCAKCCSIWPGLTLYFLILNLCLHTDQLSYQMLSSLLACLCLRSHPWLCRTVHEQCKPLKEKSATYGGNSLQTVEKQYPAMKQLLGITGHEHSFSKGKLHSLHSEWCLLSHMSC